jgi:hypothetical protein
MEFLFMSIHQDYCQQIYLLLAGTMPREFTSSTLFLTAADEAIGGYTTKQ